MRTLPTHAGWTHSSFPFHSADSLCPACEDGPFDGDVSVSGSDSAPHARGWTVIGRLHSSQKVLCPACGMDPPSGEDAGDVGPLPRMRGDGPQPRLIGQGLGTLPRMRGDGPQAGQFSLGFEALPRMRGDGPGDGVLPGQVGDSAPHAGMDPACGPWRTGVLALPRMRGDGPGVSITETYGSGSAPHARGWTCGSERIRTPVWLCPACAGMDLRRHYSTRHKGSLPRMRGDGPLPAGIRLCVRRSAPRARGWTYSSCQLPFSRTLCPACAGMDLVSAPGSRPGRALPRMRGDGPDEVARALEIRASAPHARGWTSGRYTPR